MGWNGSDPNAASVKRRREQKRIPAAAWLVVGAIAAVASIGYLATGNDGTDAAEEETPVTDRKIKANKSRYIGTPEEAVRRAMPKKMADAKPRKKRVRRPPVELYAHLQGEDRKLAEAVQKGLDADNLKATLPAARAALESENAEVRQTAVEALGWFGAAALPELTGCMADPDEDIRQLAQDKWEQALQEIEQPSDQFNIAAAAFATLSGEDELTSLGGILCNAATEMIDGEEDETRQLENRVAVVQVLVDIMEGDSAENAEAAATAYNDITGNEWLGIDEAERYLRDPDNYDPDMPAQPEDSVEVDVQNDSDGQVTDGQEQVEQPAEPAADGQDASGQPADDEPIDDDAGRAAAVTE